MLPKVIYRFNKISMKIFIQIEKNPKVCMESQGFPNIESHILNEKNKAGSITLPDSKRHDKAIKIAGCWHRQETNCTSTANQSLRKMPRAHDGGEDSLSHKWCWRIGYSPVMQWNSSTSQIKMAKDFNGRTVNEKLLEENMWGKLLDNGPDEDILECPKSTGNKSIYRWMG